jgi:HAD superfamily phosphatase (TIGR01668 family)
MDRLLQPFRPSLRAGSVTEITPAFLAGRGIRALILDLDNTLVAWHGQEVPPHVAAWLRDLHAADVQCCIVSNTHRPGRLRELAAVLGVQYVPSGGKPRRAGFRRAMTALAVTADETAVVGDQILTDIWGGNRCGLLTILVEPLSPVEFWGTRVISRNVERLLLQRLEQCGLGSEALLGEPPDTAAETEQP